MWVRAVLLILAAMAALGAAMGLSIDRSVPPVVAVMTDASPSTRGAWFRDAADVRRTVSRLASKIAPGATLRYFTFADGQALPMADVIAERGVNRTSLPAIDADAVLLLSDGQFDSTSLRTHQPIYPVVAASSPTGDARIAGVEQSGDQVAVAITNDGASRTLAWPDGTTTVVPRGSIRLTHAAFADVATVRLEAGDRWPENDTLEIRPAAALASERWWIGASPPSGFRSIDPSALPPLEAWLAVREVVLNNVPAAALDAAAQRKLTQYVRDLGGALTIVGGDHAFTAGGYGGTDLDALSPLASRPPEPLREWLVLIDASGSMASKTADGRTRLEAAVDAAGALVAALTASESVSVASFARELRAWPPMTDRRVAAPADLVANGPTNLAAALEAIVQARPADASALPLHVVALTDGDADLGAFVPLVTQAKRANITIDWLRLAGRAASGSLAAVVEQTGGNSVDAGDAAHWRVAAALVGHAIERIDAQPSNVVWGYELFAPVEPAPQANETWPRKGSVRLAGGMVLAAPPDAARWRVGAGQVAAIAYAAPAERIESVSEATAMTPHDPRFNVRWTDDDTVDVEAADAGTAINDLKMDVRDLQAETDRPPIATLEQVAPGRYRGTVPRSSSARVLAVNVDGKTVDLHAAAGGPAAEFQAIGEDRSALEKLAKRTGGRVIDRNDAAGQQIFRPSAATSLTAPLLVIAILSTLGALFSSHLLRKTS